MKYRITAVVEQDKEYINADQIQKLVSDIQMDIADYNCFCIIENVKAEEYRPDMRWKVKEYITELDEEINRCEKLYDDSSVNYSDPTRSLAIQCRIETLVQVKGDLESRLEELL